MGFLDNLFGGMDASFMESALNNYGTYYMEARNLSNHALDRTIRENDMFHPEGLNWDADVKAVAYVLAREEKRDREEENYDVRRSYYESWLEDPRVKQIFGELVKREIIRYSPSARNVEDDR